MLPNGVSSVSFVCGSCLPSAGGGSEDGLVLSVVVQVDLPGSVSELFPVWYNQGGLLKHDPHERAPWTIHTVIRFPMRHFKRFFIRADFAKFCVPQSGASKYQECFNTTMVKL